jgi:spore coat protein U-like protein
MNSCGWLLLSIAENCILKKRKKIMKMNFKQNSVKLAIAAGLVLGPVGFTAPVYASTDTSNMNVTANIDMNCTITTADIAFGEYKPTTDHASAALTADGSVSTTCTVGSSGKIIIGQGEHAGSGSSDASPVRRMALNDDSSYLLYDVFSDSDRQTSWTNEGSSGIAYTASGSAQVMTVYGKIEGGQTTAEKGSYADVLVVTVNY